MPDAVRKAAKSVKEAIGYLMAGIPDEEAPARTTLGVASDVVLSLTQMVEDSAELVSATVREELHRFRVEMARGALSGVAVVVGGSLLTAGL